MAECSVGVTSYNQEMTCAAGPFCHGGRMVHCPEEPLEALQAGGYLRRQPAGARWIKVLKVPIGSLRSLAGGEWGAGAP